MLSRKIKKIRSKEHVLILRIVNFYKIKKGKEFEKPRKRLR
jgi:hypothetical protein